jgi:tRNA threonylcarbamoyladenosine biosynthesis protein TsaE
LAQCGQIKCGVCAHARFQSTSSMIAFMHLSPSDSKLPVFTIPLINEAATEQLGAALAPCVQAGFVMYLQGDLGAGKTTLTRALLRALGVTGTLRSPTFALLEPYELPWLARMQGGTLHHFDFYRLEDTPLAWRDAGFEVAFDAPHAAIVEWPQYAQGLPTPELLVHIQHAGEQRRALLWTAHLCKALAMRLENMGGKP